jgi:hypothetical protein
VDVGLSVSIRGRGARTNQEVEIGDELESAGDRSLRGARSRESHMEMDALCALL